MWKKKQIFSGYVYGGGMRSVRVKLNLFPRSYSLGEISFFAFEKRDERNGEKLKYTRGNERERVQTLSLFSPLSLSLLRSFVRFLALSFHWETAEGRWMNWAGSRCLFLVRYTYKNIPPFRIHKCMYICKDLHLGSLVWEVSVIARRPTKLLSSYSLLLFFFIFSFFRFFLSLDRGVSSAITRTFNAWLLVEQFFGLSVILLITKIDQRGTAKFS